MRLDRPTARGDSLDDLPGVVKVTDFGKMQELRVTPHVRSQQMLTELMRRGTSRI